MIWLPIWHFLVHWTGSDYGANYGQFQPYDFLSGVAGLSLLGILINTFRKHNCGTRWCWRIGHHEWKDGNGLSHHLCRKHHPEHPGKPITALHICQIHRERMEG